jgi:hypothetical protein
LLRTPKKHEVLPDVLDRRELVRLLDATERDDVWMRTHEGKRERDRLLLALFAYACASAMQDEPVASEVQDAHGPVARVNSLAALASLPSYLPGRRTPAKGHARRKLGSLPERASPRMPM